jgi:beta-D-xylosidase 4
VAAAAAADYVVLALGIDSSLENEMHDRISIDLPAVQHQLAAAVGAVGKPMVVVLLHGGSVDVSPERDSPGVGAILDAGYPGMLGGTVIAQTLLGDNSHLGGKLSMTCYPAEYVNQINMTDMELDTPPGRGYRFYTGAPVFPFGYGLSLSKFTLQLAAGPPTTPATLPTEALPTTTLNYTVLVTNTGEVAGDEVVQAYFLPQSVPQQPKSRLLKQLFGYQRLHLDPGQGATVSFLVNSETLRLVDRESGDAVSTPGSFDVLFTNGVDQALHNPVTVQGPQVVVAPFPS